MHKKLIVNWSNTHQKQISYTSNVQKGVINVGNKNSYSDCFIPKSNLVLNEVSFKENNEFISSSETIQNFINKNKIGLFGIPGRGNVTIGGAIAADTHGKDNIWGGSFAKNIKSVYLLTSSNKIIEISKDNDFDVFQATIGGYGLTGSIVGCKFENNLPEIGKTYIQNNLTGKGIYDLTSNFEFKKNEYAVGWLNLLSKDFKWVIQKYIKKNEFVENNLTKTNDFQRGSLPFVGYDYFKTLSLVNNMYFVISNLYNKRTVNINDVLFPLNRFYDSRNLAKARKIVQVQFSIPQSENLELLLNTLIINQYPILCSVKKLNNQFEYSNLSFFQNGWTVAVDFPYNKLNYSSLRKFYQLLIKLNGKVYLAKDTTLLKEEFKEMYSEYHKWSKVVKKIDPNNYFQSELSNRLELKKW